MELGVNIYVCIKYSNKRFEKTNEDSFATAGYMTAYNFFKYPQMTRKRIAQFLILPEYQGKGIGPKLLEAFYDDCLKDENVYDITGIFEDFML